MCSQWDAYLAEMIQLKCLVPLGVQETIAVNLSMLWDKNLKSLRKKIIEIRNHPTVTSQDAVKVIERLLLHGRPAIITLPSSPATVTVANSSVLYSSTAVIMLPVNKSSSSTKARTSILNKSKKNKKKDWRVLREWVQGSSKVCLSGRKESVFQSEHRFCKWWIYH